MPHGLALIHRVQEMDMRAHQTRWVRPAERRRGYEIQVGAGERIIRVVAEKEAAVQDLYLCQKFLTMGDDILLLESKLAQF